VTTGLPGAAEEGGGAGGLIDDGSVEDDEEDAIGLSLPSLLSLLSL
jgi:hypothetical protein